MKSLVFRYKEAGEALRRKQDKEREAAGLPPVQRVGARGAAPAQRGQQRGAPPARGGRGAPVQRGGRGGGGGGPPRTMHTAADKNLYVHLLGHLRKKNLLPVVVFTFSKKRCEENAATLTNADLCTSVEKSEVHVAIEKALSRLKGLSVFQFGRPGSFILSRIGQETPSNSADSRFTLSRHRHTSRRTLAFGKRGALQVGSRLYNRLSRIKAGGNSLRSWVGENTLCDRDICHGKSFTRLLR